MVRPWNRTLATETDPAARVVNALGAAVTGLVPAIVPATRFTPGCLATLRALGHAQAFQPDVLEAVTVAVEPDSTAELREQWEAAGLDVPLKQPASPYLEITEPVTAYVRSLKQAGLGDAVAFLIPEYVVGHWWETLPHNQSAPG